MNVTIGLRRAGRLAPFAGVALLGGCARPRIRLFDPVGVISHAEWRFTVINVLIMLCIIAPTTLFILISAWRYRLGRGAKFDPEFNHSVKLEVLMWGVPLAAVIALGYFSWRGAFGVNPYAPSRLEHRAAGAGSSTHRLATAHPLVINAVATDWQWVFIYPKQGIATLNTVDIPAGRVIEFRLTATDVVNDFYIPQLVGMIDVMPGMRTMDDMRVDRVGTWIGFSANISGAGFAWMQFPTHVVAPADFTAWVARTKAGGGNLTYAQFEKIARPTVNVHHHHAAFGAVGGHLFSRIVTAARNGKTYPTPMGLTKHMAASLRAHAGYLTDYANQKS